MCCSFFSLSFFTVCFVCCILQIYTHPIIDLIRREREREHARSTKEKRETTLEILFSLSLPASFCICMCVCRKKAERLSILPYTYIHTSEIRLSVRFPLSSTSIYVRIKRKRRNSKDIKPMAHLTIVTKRYCAFMYVFGINANNWFHTTMLDRYFR